VRIRLGRGFWTSKWGLALLGLCLLFLLGSAGVYTYFHLQFSRMIDQRLSGQVFGNTSRVFAAPRRIAVGESLRASELAAYLQRAGYTESEVPGAPGRYRLSGNTVEIRPSANSLFRGHNALRVEFSADSVERIVSLREPQSLTSAELEPELLTNLFDSAREKRRLARYEDLPRHLVDAVLSAEDKRFFEHPGFDPIRVLGAAWNNLRRSDRMEGASTISMQVARSYFFSLERRGWAAWRRKAAETMVALQLEQRFSKEQIFELYANQIYLGNRGSFAIRGFGEAAQAYFGKDVRELTLAEAAFLAGIARAPNRYSSAERNLDRAAEARDRVLAQMAENSFISPEAAEAARRAPWRFVSGTLESGAAPYFVDLVKDHLLERYSEQELISQSLSIYTTLDLDLQKAAAEAVEIGMRHVDAQLARRYERWRLQQKKTGESAPKAQVALIALDPRTGEIKALIGGRQYSESQLNRVLARRQPGSAFKPFVYAAAFDNFARHLQPIVTPVTTVVDEPTTFFFENKEYTPNNYGESFFGRVTLREALRRSLNVATVKLAEMIGYDRVVEMARQLGLDPGIQATPAVALGAYEMTPLDVAAGYTVFASGGIRVEPMFLRSVVSADGMSVQRNLPRTRAVLDPRTAYVVTSLLIDVVNRGTAAGVRSRGFTAPAAGKTGTSQDGWFAGYTTNLLCVVWVGFDDNRELGLAGANSAAPIWAEFMKRAVALPAYSDAHEFPVPDGVTIVQIDEETAQLATPNCHQPREEVFVTGSEPTDFCWRHGGRSLATLPPVSWLARIFGGKKQASDAETDSNSAGVEPAKSGPQVAEASGSEAGGREKSKPPMTSPVKSAVIRKDSKPAAASAPPETQQQEQKGFFRRLWSIFGGGKKKEESKPSRPSAPPKSGAPSPPAKPGG
jgi:penicillin-binding protein 1B